MQSQGPLNTDEEPEGKWASEWHSMRGAQPAIAGLERWEKGPRAKPRRPPLDAEAGTEADSAPEPSGGTQPCRHPDFSPMRQALDL